MILCLIYIDGAGPILFRIGNAQTAFQCVNEIPYRYFSSTMLPYTVTYTESGTPMMNWDSQYLCHFSTEMAEIWSSGTSFQDDWTCRISALLYLLYFQSYETFSGNHKIHHKNFHNFESTRDRELKFCVSKHL